MRGLIEVCIWREVPKIDYLEVIDERHVKIYFTFDGAQYYCIVDYLLDKGAALRHINNKISERMTKDLSLTLDEYNDPHLVVDLGDTAFESGILYYRFVKNKKN